MLVDNDRERWRMRSYGDIPSQGSLIGVWHKPTTANSVEGGIDKGVQSIMALGHCDLSSHGKPLRARENSSSRIIELCNVWWDYLGLGVG